MLPEPPNKHQKKRVAKYLSENENLILITGIGKRYFWLSLFFLLILPLVLTYTGIFMFFGYFEITQYPWIKFMVIPSALLLIYTTPKYSHLLRMRQSLIYVLTSKRFMIIRGIFSRKILTAPLVRITHVTVEQSIFQRFLFNSGHLVIITAGYDQREIVIENIGNPLQFKIWIDELTEDLESSNDTKDNIIDKEDEDDEVEPKSKFKLRSLKA